MLRPRSMVVVSAALLLANACADSSETSRANTRRVENAEYRFSVAFPEDLHVCNAMSGENVHGFFVLLDSRDCRIGAETSNGNITVYAYYNSSFESNPEDETSGLCKRRVNDDVGVDTRTLEFFGRRSAKCLVRTDDGSINIFVVTQAGRWPDAGQSPEWDTPMVNYTATLHTTPNRIAEDLKAFRAVLASVQIGYTE